MLENQNNNIEPVVISSQSEGYYKNGPRKFGDFLIGFIGIDIDDPCQVEEFDEHMGGQCDTYDAGRVLEYLGY